MNKLSHENLNSRKPQLSKTLTRKPQLSKTPTLKNPNSRKPQLSKTPASAEKTTYKKLHILFASEPKIVREDVCGKNFTYPLAVNISVSASGGCEVSFWTMHNYIMYSKVCQKM